MSERLIEHQGRLLDSGDIRSQRSPVARQLGERFASTPMTGEGLRVFSRAEQAAGRNAERHVPAGKSGRSLRVTAHKRELVGLGAKEMTSARRLYQFWKLGSRDRLGIYLVGVRGGRFVARAPRRRPAAVGQAANAPRSRRSPELRAGAAADAEDDAQAYRRRLARRRRDWP